MRLFNYAILFFYIEPLFATSWPVAKWPKWYHTIFLTPLFSKTIKTG